MQDHQSLPESDPRDSASRRLRWGVLAGVSAIVLMAGGAGAWVAWRNLATHPSPVASTAPTTTVQQPSQISPSPTTATPAATEQAAQVYWVKATDTRIELVSSPVEVNRSDRPEVTLKLAFEQLLKGPTKEGVSSTIPEGTTLQSLEIKEDGIHVDLSKSFTEGGGSTSMTGRLGQVIYTATSLDPNAKVWISVDGEPLETLGGEGLIVDQPMTRTDFDANFPL